MSKRIPLLAVEVLLVCVLLRGAGLVRFPLRDAREHAFQQKAAAAALITQVDDRDQIERAFPNADDVLGVVPFMREKRLSVFAESDQAELGVPLDSFVNVVTQDECRGAVQSVTSIQEVGTQDFRISGWAWDLTLRAPVSHIVVVADGRVVGLGAVGDWRPTIRAVNPYMKTSFIGFTAYAKNVPPATAVSINAVLRTRPERACQIATIEPSQGP